MKTAATWKQKEARDHFDEVMKEAAQHRPQAIALAGGVVVIVALAEDVEPGTKPVPHIGELFLNSPLKGAGVEFPRIEGPERKVDLGEE